MLIKFFSSNRIFIPTLVLFLSAPLFFHGFRFGIPYVKGGDEPHFLIETNSLLQDGDWDLKNNYESVWEGSDQAGKKYAGKFIDPHAWYKVSGKMLWWTDVYENPATWKKDSKGHWIPAVKPGIDESSLQAYPAHPYGLPFLLALILWPVRHTSYIEPFALLLANLSVIISAFLYRKVIARYTSEEWIINASVFIVFMGTPIWAYSRTLFTQPFLILFALSAYLVALEGKSGFFAGVLLGLGIFMNPTMCLLLIPLLIFYLAKKEWKNSLGMLMGPVMALLSYLYINNKLFGSPFYFPEHQKFGNVLNGFLGLWLSWNHGIIPFMPVVLFVFYSWGKFIREKGLEAVVWGGGFASYFLFMADLAYDWQGGWCYGPRQIVPVITFLMIPIFYNLKFFPESKKWISWVFVALCLLSVVFNALGAMDGYWSSHPLTILEGNIS